MLKVESPVYDPEYVSINQAVEHKIRCRASKTDSCRNKEERRNAYKDLVI